jgi:hypothetical protein
MSANESLNEIRYGWTFIDVMKGNALLDMRDDMKGTFDAFQERELKKK